MERLNTTFGIVSYRTFGKKDNQTIVVYTALGACTAEWWHIAEELSSSYFVLLFERPGYAGSSWNGRSRDPYSIAREVKEILDLLKISDVNLVGHSMGGLYSFVFAQLFPSMVKSLVLLDPVSPTNYRFKKELDPYAYYSSGIDKRKQLKWGRLVCALGISRLFKGLLKKAPPFYYNPSFSKEAEQYILDHEMKKSTYVSALNEYRFLDDIIWCRTFISNAIPLDIPLKVVYHSPEVVKREIMEFGRTGHDTASAIESLWVGVMNWYNMKSSDTTIFQSSSGSHFLHLTDRKLVVQVICQTISNVEIIRSNR